MSDRQRKAVFVWLVMKRRDEGVTEHWVAKRPLMLGGPKLRPRVQTAASGLAARLSMKGVGEGLRSGGEFQEGKVRIGKAPGAVAARIQPFRLPGTAERDRIAWRMLILIAPGEIADDREQSRLET